MEVRINPKLISTIMKLGFSEYEARTYISLINLGPASASEISNNSNVPQAKIYQVLQDLAQKGIVEISTTTRPRIFNAIPANQALNQILSRLTRQSKQAIKQLEELHLKGSETLRVIPENWLLSNPPQIKNKIQELFKSTKYELTVSISNPLLMHYIELLNKMRGLRALSVRILTPMKNTNEINLKKKFNLTIKAADLKVNFIIGDRKLMFLHFMSNDQNESAIYTWNRELISFFRNYFIKSWEAV